ncbi:MAG TPA: hypothetical protein VJ499_08580, partial [Flavisolibacter sp.]|nr:hypothetical protein [Flavisolibacter sp.]
YLLFYILIIFQGSCTNPENKVEGSELTGPLFYSLRIWGEEGNDSVTCMFQYHTGGINGPVVFPGENASVELDKKNMKPDSANLSGPYYDLRSPLQGFDGKHIVRFSGNGSQFNDIPFEFHAFHSAPDWPLSIKKGQHEFKLENFPQEGSVVRLSMVDTSFTTNDFNEIVTVHDGILKITEAMLEELTPGPISMEITREQEILDKKGKIWMSYSLRKEFELLK